MFIPLDFTKNHSIGDIYDYQTFDGFKLLKSWRIINFVPIFFSWRILDGAINK